MSQRNFFPATADLLPTDSLLLFFESKVIANGDNFLWQLDSIKHILGVNEEMFLVDEAAGTAFIVVNLKQDVSEFLSAELRSLRGLLFKQGDSAFAVAGKASQIVDWYKTHQYCGCCGQENVQHGAQRALVCKSCNQQYFPRINPCAIMLVVKGDQMLLARSARFSSPYYSCLAGFIEVGETPEQTVAREVLEEVGVEVENIRYIKSQSWPFPSQLMLGYIADYKSGDIVPDADEIAEADWFSADNLPTVPSPKISVAGELIEYFINHSTKT